MAIHKTIRLDMIDGLEFERVCADIFSGAGMGRIERRGGSGDGGIDLLIHGDDGGLTAVECKHHPDNPISRPIVQKLHSAMLKEGTRSGIIATTGRFTKEAKEYAATLPQGGRIELVDFSRLVDIADRAGVHLASGRRDQLILYLHAPSAHDARAAAMARLDSLQSRPAAPSELAEVTGHTVRLEPYYLARADVRQDFSTSVGLIHSVSERDACVLVDARTGSVAGPNMTSFLEDSPLASSWDADGVHVSRDEFACDAHEAVGTVKRHLAGLHTTDVSYRGRNNVGYSKRCEVSPRSVHIADIKQVLLPVHAMEIAVLRSRYACSVVSNEESTELAFPDLEKCGLCGKGVPDDAALCNSCGTVHHPPRILGCRGHRCKECGRTVCRQCAFWTRRLLFFKRIMCGACASGIESAARLQ